MLFLSAAGIIVFVLAEGVQADQLVDNQSYSDAPVSQSSNPQAENTQKDESVSKAQLCTRSRQQCVQGKADFASSS